MDVHEATIGFYSMGQPGEGFEVYQITFLFLSETPAAAVKSFRDVNFNRKKSNTQLCYNVHYSKPVGIYRDPGIVVLL